MSQVLIIAKTKQLKQNLINTFKKSGVDTSAVDNFEEGIASLTANTPMLAILQEPEEDITVSVLHEFIQTKAPGTALLVALNHHNMHNALKYMQMGAYDCLSPDFTTGDLFAAAKHSCARFGRHLVTAGIQPVLTKSVRIMIAATVITCLSVILLTAAFKHYKLSKAVFYQVPSPHPTSIYWQDKQLWVTDWYDQAINLYRLPKKTSGMLPYKTISLAEYEPLGIVAADNFIYTLGGDGNVRKHKLLNKQFPTLLIAKTPGQNPSGITWDGDSLWSCDSKTRFIYKHGIRLNVLQSFPCPAQSPGGIAWDGKYLWIADSGTQQLYRMSISGMNWSFQGPYSLKAMGQNLKISGIAYNAKRLWTISEAQGLLIGHAPPILKKKAG